MAPYQSSFFGYEPRWITPDRLYIICLAGGMISGLRVGGQLMATRRSVPWPEDPAHYAKQELLLRYGLEAPWSVELVFQDAKNFQLPATDVETVEVATRRRWWTGPIPNSGSVRFRLRSGKKRTFILLGRQDPHDVRSALATAGVAVTPQTPQREVV